MLKLEKLSKELIEYLNSHPEYISEFRQKACDLYQQFIVEGYPNVTVSDILTELINDKYEYNKKVLSNDINIITKLIPLYHTVKLKIESDQLLDKLLADELNKIDEQPKDS
jgi:hypothetical protein